MANSSNAEQDDVPQLHLKPRAKRLKYRLGPNPAENGDIGKRNARLVLQSVQPISLHFTLSENIRFKNVTLGPAQCTKTKPTFLGLLFVHQAGPTVTCSHCQEISDLKTQPFVFPPHRWMQCRPNPTENGTRSCCEESPPQGLKTARSSCPRARKSCEGRAPAALRSP